MRASLPRALWRAQASFRANQMTDHAAALTYYMMMSLFPALLTMVTLLGLLGTPELITDAVRFAREQGAERATVDALEQSLQGAIERSGGAVSFALVISVLVSLYGASGAFGAAGRALNVVYGVKEDRNFVRQKAQNLLFTLLVVLLGIITLVSVFLGGSIAEEVFGTIGLGSTAATVWTFGRWLVAFAAMVLVYAVVYAFSPDITPRRFRWLSPGAVLGVLIWIVAAVGFFFYVKNFGKYGATYGAFATAVILLLFLWLTCVCLLLGAEVNAEIERAETAVRGGPPPLSAPPTPADPAPAPPAPVAARDRALD